MNSPKYIYIAVILIIVTGAGMTAYFSSPSERTAAMPTHTKTSTQAKTLTPPITSISHSQQSVKSDLKANPQKDAYLKSVLQSEQSDPLLQLLAKDAKYTLSYLSRFGEAYDQSFLSTTVLKYLQSQENWTDSLALLKSVNVDSEWYLEVLAASLRQYGVEDYPSACQWIGKYPNLSGANESAEALGRLAGLTDSPQTAYDQVKLYMTADHLMAHYYKGLTSEWAQHDLEAVMAFMNSLPPSPVMDLAVHDFVVNVGIQVDPAVTMSWAESVTDKKLQQSAIVKTAGMMQEQNTENYRLWRLHNQLPPHIENNLP